MGKNDSINEENLTIEIEDAVEDLFSEFDQIEIDPVTSEIKKAAEEQLTELEILTMETGDQEAERPKEILETADDLFSQSDHALLSLEWEVTPENIQNARDLIFQIKSNFESKDIVEADEVFTLMSQILNAMEESPQDVPTTGPKSLKDALDVLKNISTDDTSRSEISSAVANVISSLQASLPSAPPALEAEEIIAEEEATPEKISPQEGVDFDFSGQEPEEEPFMLEDEETLDLEFGTEKVEETAEGEEAEELSLEPEIEEEEKAEEVEEEAFELSFEPEPEEEKVDMPVTVEEPVLIQEPAPETRPVSPEPKPQTLAAAGVEAHLPVPADLIRVIQTNVTMLERCIERVVPLENLFGKTQGYEKLHIINKKLRKQLELQRDSLTKALTGDYLSLSGQATTPIQQVRVSQSSNQPCPFTELVLAKWRGSFAAFRPDQIAYVAENAISAYDKYSKSSELPLKHLKKYPWSKLHPLFQGPLADTPEAELKKMRIPIYDHPGIFEVFAEPAEDNFIMVLCRGESKGAVFLDTETVEFKVAKQWPWETSYDKDSLIAGYLNIHGTHLPVISLP